MKLVVFLSALVGLISMNAASPEEFSSMVGTWEGKSEAVVLGNAVYYEDTEGEVMPRLTSVQFVLNLTHQEGRLFWGTLTSSRIIEEWIATFWND
jgi:hypothetical protein